MNEILTSSQQREADGYTIMSEPISSILLMERAASEFLKSIIPYINGKQTIHVFCGTGNNGGDGLAVARMLREKGCNTHVYLVKHSTQLSSDCIQNLAKLSNVITIEDDTTLPDIHAEHIVIDAIFGSGLTRPVEGIAATIITLINQSKACVLSIDIPSGLPCDSVPFVGGIVINAHFTATFERPKLAFFLPESSTYINEWKVISIGLNQHYISTLECTQYYLSAQFIQEKIKPRTRFSHKGTYGHGLVIAGSKGKIGAAVLSTRAALRSGIGLVSAHVPECGYPVIQSIVPEAMCSTDSDSEKITSLPILDRYNAIAIGPGLGICEDTTHVIAQLLTQCSVSLVIDADAINSIASHPTLRNTIPPFSILTPHPKEFERLVGQTNNSIDRLEKLKQFCKEHQVITVLKDAVTVICFPNGQLYFNTTGNPGMATAGSGDVLTGMILALLAQGYTPQDSALIAVYHHGKAGDLAAKHIGEFGMIASDIIDSIRITS